VQIVIADVDANGRALSTSTSFALSGQVRAQGEGDDSLNRLATKAGREPEPFPPCGEIGIDGASLDNFLFIQCCATCGAIQNDSVAFPRGVYSRFL
jgi:Ribosomal protein S21e